ncbi:hypothetical protein Phum_PHUM103430 [Pediculus humanus corporis]|uniref:DUF4485 domain-containing protein n=1 Tax=Pediculus humanus subsp. corporis TaxID=121224 RepID=E0VD09_PEDHC|nr:uncharacterized protein Phum_PHUM103430 [Pediculus humanus corporis]EEB11265.1 hypothetical protein Phum_PHUM103430 [Pediculus humanus corporis]
MSDESKEFLCNILLVKALLQYLPHSEKKKAVEWLAKIQDPDENIGELKTRNEYSFYLLLNVQNGSMSQPFNKSPPPGKLKPLFRILPDYVYEEVLKQFKTGHCRLNKLLNVSDEVFDFPELFSTPNNFESQHPRPRSGIFSHCAVFSDYPNCEKS